MVKSGKVHLSLFFDMYKPPLLKESIVNGVFDEDLYQELCPLCSRIIQGDGKRFECECGWNITRAELHKTYKRKQLVGGAAMLVIEKAIQSFPAKGAYADKMLWIDNLIHAFHGELNTQYEKTELAYRPIARNFIEGSLEQVVELIYNLAYGDNPDLIKSRSEWIEKLKMSYVPDHITDRYF